MGAPVGDWAQLVAPYMLKFSALFRLGVCAMMMALAC